MCVCAYQTSTEFVRAIFTRTYSVYIFTSRHSNTIVHVVLFRVVVRTTNVFVSVLVSRVGTEYSLRMVAVRCVQLQPERFEIIKRSKCRRRRRRKNTQREVHTWTHTPIGGTYTIAMCYMSTRFVWYSASSPRTMVTHNKQYTENQQPTQMIMEVLLFIWIFS